ncbi:ABC transporter ATP-binding protein [Microbacterium sp. W4I20]|uniref:ABC transporter ATP-binding protein n=1 Tax=Microbacterium sp. W4I20 TaxID=3042262 RepID=UPI002785C476|nr:ABC transporter ATP-binding protein [Microbacterium sp. W4I20]MDQ0728991.1 ABC-type multidrug transport system ATPase subunit [Microbacterium sp. W4I20]
MTPSPDDRTDQVDDSETPPDTTSVKRTPPVKQTSKPRTTAKKTPVKGAAAAKKPAVKKPAAKTPARAAAEKAAPTGEVVIEPAVRMVIDPPAPARTSASARSVAAKNTAARTSAARGAQPAASAAARAASARSAAPKTTAGSAKTPAARTAAAKTAAAKSAAAKAAAAKSTARSATARSTSAKTAAAKAAAAKSAAAKAAAAKAAEDAAAEAKAAEALSMPDAVVEPPAPIVEEPSAEEPQPTAEESAVEEPVIDEPVIDEPVIDDPAVEEPAVEQPVTDDPAVEERTTEEPLLETDDTEEPILDATDTPDEAVVAVTEAGDSASDAVGDLGAVSATEAIRIRGLVKQFGDNRAVDGIDLTVPAGSFYGIVGPNGAGKTTTLSIVAGLLRPDEGTVVICGVDQAEKPLAAKRVMGVLPDRLRTFDRLTGRQLLYYYGLLRGLAADVIEKRAADLARAFDLGDALSRVVSDYSAGMTKKIMLAGAMIHSPRVLVLDEPFESVDPVSSAVILDILRAYVSHGGTVILSSHGMDLVERVCSRVAIIVGGEVLAEGTIEEVRAGQTLEARFVELAGSSGEVEGLEWLHTFSD